MKKNRINMSNSSKEINQRKEHIHNRLSQYKRTKKTETVMNETLVKIIHHYKPIILARVIMMMTGFITIIFTFLSFITDLIQNVALYI